MRMDEGNSPFQGILDSSPILQPNGNLRFQEQSKNEPNRLKELFSLAEVQNALATTSLLNGNRGLNLD